MDLIKRSWCEINLKKLKQNFNSYLLCTQKDIMAVVKADAYGHGAIQVSKFLQECGVSNFAVSNVIEGIELRSNGINGQILILGYTPLENISEVLKYDLTQALVSEDYSKKIFDLKLPIKCQYAIDTGMNRIGINAEDLNECERQIREAAGNVNLTGIFTHLCVADDKNDFSVNFTKLQLLKFKKVIECVKDLKLRYIHSMNSVGGLEYEQKETSFSRLGIVLYGLKPNFEYRLPNKIEPIMEWKSIISMVKYVNCGEIIGYGGTYKAEKRVKIATVSTGYADGYDRRLSNLGYVLLHGKKAPIVGKICMDQFMIDVTEIEDVTPYEEVVLIGKSGDEILTADDMARMIETIGYEIVCNISKRVNRKYIY